MFKRGTFVQHDPADANKLWGEWHFVKGLVSPSPNVDDQFGWSVSITPWNIIIGAPAGIAGSPTEKGSATIWKLDPSSLIPATYPSRISGENSGDQFGYSVLIKSQITLIGAVGVDTGAVSNTGRIYEYVRYSDACNQWTITQPILPPALANIPNSGFGTSLELGYNCVLISAPNGNNQALNQGVTFAFDTPEPIAPCDSDLNGDGGTGSADLSVVLSHWGDLGGEGDINGDGIVNGQDLLYVVSYWGPCICGN